MVSLRPQHTPSSRDEKRPHPLAPVSAAMAVLARESDDDRALPPLPDAGRLWRTASAAAELEALLARSERAARPALIGQAAGLGVAAAGLSGLLSFFWQPATAWLGSLSGSPATLLSGNAVGLLLAVAIAAVALAGALRPTGAT